MEGSSSSSSGANGSGSKLNPHAREWHPSENRTPETMRTLFVTFTRQNPITDRDIAWFFNYNYGRCVQRVVMFSGAPPVSAMVVFRVASVPRVIMENAVSSNDAARFWVNGKPFWCRWYEGRRRRNHNRNQQDN